MSCISCFSLGRKDVSEIKVDGGMQSGSRDYGSKKRWGSQQKDVGSGRSRGSKGGNEATGFSRSFTFRELAMATRKFKEVNLIGEGGFGRVYRGRLETGEASLMRPIGIDYEMLNLFPLTRPVKQVVAIKQLNHDGLQGFQEFVVEVLMLSLLHHPNLVTLHGYCADRDQRLLVYEYMSMGSLEYHLFDLDPEQAPLDWNTRMKIAVIDTRRKQGQQNLIVWSRPYLNDRRKFIKLADPLLEGRFPTCCLHHAIAITAMCLQDQPTFRPLIRDIVIALEFISAQSSGTESLKQVSKLH
ncbi:hypothetical protein MLD38_034344 [Melastoma candidum]|uniref:Uncharacterized protein n=1 Tax=Melastoma candidum TaxID=119954 RepID=A0ACB9MDC9_9MYRT|nr:hypothetical protein MLD38_034344 [Melastoma candidum]